MSSNKYWVVDHCDGSLRGKFSVVEAASHNEACCLIAGVVVGNEYHGKCAAGPYASRQEAEAAADEAYDTYVPGCG